MLLIDFLVLSYYFVEGSEIHTNVSVAYEWVTTDKAKSTMAKLEMTRYFHWIHDIDEDIVAEVDISIEDAFNGRMLPSSFDFYLTFVERQGDSGQV
jgi:hypothetical protein